MAVACLLKPSDERGERLEEIAACLPLGRRQQALKTRWQRDLKGSGLGHFLGHEEASTLKERSPLLTPGDGARRLDPGGRQVTGYVLLQKGKACAAMMTKPVAKLPDH